MRVATWEAIKDIRITEAPAPEPGPADVVIDVAACGICGSDVHSYLEGSWIAQGLGMGHEYAGTVTLVGSGVSGLEVGDRVALNPAVYCGNCVRCRDGHENLCSAMTGASPGFADQAVIRNADVGVNVFRLPNELSFEAAAMLEPLSVAMRAVRELAPPLSEPILVTGLGSIGQCVVQVLLAEGASCVVGVDTSAPRRDAASQSGAHLVVDPEAGDLTSALLDRFGTTSSPYRSDSGAIGAAFECSGAAAVFAPITRLVRAAGSVSLVALTAAPIQIDPNPIVQKELKVRGSFAYTSGDVQAAFELLAEAKVKPAHLVSHRYDLADIGQAFQAQADSGSSVKVMVTPGLGTS